LLPGTDAVCVQFSQGPLAGAVTNDVQKEVKLKPKSGGASD